MNYPTAIVLAAAMIAGAVIWTGSAKSENAASPVQLSASDNSDSWLTLSDGRVLYCSYRGPGGASRVTCWDKNGKTNTP